MYLNPKIPKRRVDNDQKNPLCETKNGSSMIKQIVQLSNPVATINTQHC